MKGQNASTQTVNYFTINVKTSNDNRSENISPVSFDNLVPMNCFLNEVGMDRNELMRFRKLGRVDGLISLPGKILVDRTKINIHYREKGDKFRRWIALGGRLGPVNVKLNKAYEPPISVQDISKGL